MFTKLYKKVLPLIWFLKNVRDAHHILTQCTPVLRREREKYYREARKLRKDGKDLNAALAMGKVHFIDEFLKRNSTYDL